MYKRTPQVYPGEPVMLYQQRRSHVCRVYPVEGQRVLCVRETLMDKIKRALRIGHPYARRCRA